jgi:putative ATP-dependent endonuclease of the OLD family
MYLQTLIIKNFRKYKNLKVDFTKGLNLLVGENDSGKTAIIDAIKYVLHTQSYEYIRPNYEDFHLTSGAEENQRSRNFNIECVFHDFQDYEAKSFLEWLSFDDNGKYYLKMWLKATRKDSKVYYEIRAGADDDGSQISGEARDYLRCAYLKPLRDAESELTPKRGSRLSQILDSHDQFSDKENHRLKRIINLANKAIEKYFTHYDGKDLLEDVNKYLKSFSLEENQLNSTFQISNNTLKSILEKLSLKLFNHEISENNIQGLGSNNLLYIAAELLLLKKLEYSGLKLALIEEIEAHLHPQTQIRLIESIQSIGEENNIQFILTSHSPNLASKVKLENLIVCKDGCTYPMGKKYTKLLDGDYYFLERFLDSTKANMFFANGVILVEGDAENILVPALSKLISRDLSKYGVSIVNVGSTAFLRYANIFLRADKTAFNIPVSLITDVDVKPIECKPKIEDKEMTGDEIEAKRNKTIIEKEAKYSEPIVSFIAPYWTLEYSIALSCLSELFWQAVYICWKKKGEDYVYTNEQRTALIIEANEEYSKWQKAYYSSAKKAYKIYKETLLDKQLSKAVVAQVFSQLLNERDPEDIRNDENLKYLVRAINYATGAK